MDENRDKVRCLTLIADTHAYYKKDVSQALLRIYWEGLKQFSFEDVEEAIRRHTMDPDKGSFLPLVSDIIRLISGNSRDVAMMAWTRLVSAVGRVGMWRSVVFDDHLIHRVVDDMGGWSRFGGFADDELPFRAKDFMDRYRIYLNAPPSATVTYPAVLLGFFDQDAEAKSLPLTAPVLLGNQELAAQVMKNGLVVSSPVAPQLAATPKAIPPRT